MQARIYMIKSERDHVPTCDLQKEKREQAEKELGARLLICMVGSLGLGEKSVSFFIGKLYHVRSVGARSQYCCFA
jgi:hypothetical protein